MLLVFAASNAFTISQETLDNYYPDSTFTTACGFTDDDPFCTQSYSQSGTLTNYRYHEIVNCNTGTDVIANCQEYDSGTSTWVHVDCPNETVTIEGRLRVPTG